jgi:hypothetical protein
MFRIEHNLETGEVKEIKLTAKEIGEKEAADLIESLRMQEAQDKAVAKSALLNRLGMTAEEAALLLS